MPCLDSPPRYFLCPISLEIMVDPVTLPTGHTYDRTSIQRWFHEGHKTCPITMLTLSDFSLTPNRILSRLITDWSQQIRAQHQKSHDQRLKELLKASLQEPSTSRKFNSETLSILAKLPFDSATKTVLGDGKTLALLFDSLLDESIDTRMNAARILGTLLDSRTASVDLHLSSEVSYGLKRLMTENEHPKAMAAGLNLLRSLVMTCSASDTSCSARVDFVPVLVELLPNYSPECVETALETLEMLTATTEGKEALITCPLLVCISSLTAFLLKITEKCTLYAVLILLTIFKSRPEEDVANTFLISGLPRKLLLVLQSNCNPALKKRALELLKLLDKARISTTAGAMNFKVRFETAGTLL